MMHPTLVLNKISCMGGCKERWSDSETGQPAQLLALLRLRTLIVRLSAKRGSAHHNHSSTYMVIAVEYQ